MLYEQVSDDILDYYETVQYTFKMLPKVYLMGIIGTIGLRKQCSSMRLLLKDLTSMAKCIQNPMKGVFLRYFLLNILKKYLPTNVTAEDDEYEEGLCFDS